MKEQRTFWFLITVMSAVSICVAGTALYIMYVQSFDQQRERLRATAHSQARLIEAVARHDREHMEMLNDSDARDFTINQIVEAHRQYEGFGRTGEFTLAKLENDTIVFLLRHRHGESLSLNWNPSAISINDTVAEPMRLALWGESGTVVGLDYRGEKVLAAHEPVAELNWGIVAKMDLDEIREPFEKGAILTGVIASLLILVGAFTFVRVSNPLIRKLESNAAKLSELAKEKSDYADKLEKANERLKTELAEKLNAEEALRSSENRYRTMIETSAEGVWIIDHKGITTFVNAQMAEMLGYSVDHMLGKPVSDFLDDEHSQLFWPKLEKVSKGHSERFDFCLRHANRSNIWGIVSVKPIHLDDGAFAGTFAMITDITQRKRMEKELARAEKLESVGSLAAGIAHDFNNILATILGNVSLAKTHTEANGEIAELIGEAEKATLRARDLTGRLLTFSKGGAPLLQSTSIRQVIQDSAVFALHGSSVGSEFDIAEDLHNVNADEGQISQVINNLVINAKQAMPDGGTVRVGADNVRIPEDNGMPLREGDYVRISVVDQGQGIPEEHLGRIYDPFFSTKHKGNGLGLFSCYSIVRHHSGAITVDSKPNAGTTFSVYLPALPAGEKREQKETVDQTRGNGRILIMDDDKTIRMVVNAILTKLGYEAWSASDGQEAIELYEHSHRTGQSFDAVIMDLTIPGGMGGKEAIGKLKEIDPDIRAIVSSGYSDDPVMADPQAYGFSDKVIKPFKAQDLGAVVTRVLAERTGKLAADQ